MRIIYNFLIYLLIESVILQTLNKNLTSFEQTYVNPTLYIAIFVNPYNKINELPFVLSAIENQIYPKERISLLIKTEIFTSVKENFYDQNIDRFRNNHLTLRILKKWKKTNELNYNEFDLDIDEIDDKIDEKIIDYWSINRYTQIMNYKHQAVRLAIKKWADFCLILDSDVILSNENTFRYLIENNKNLTVFSPMLYSLKTYSNFWAGMNENSYYLRTDDYLPILERQKQGIFSVPMVHSAIFINLNDIKSRKLKFRHNDLSIDVPFDDVIVFAKSAQLENISLNIDNHHVYGFIMPSIEKYSFDLQKQNLIDLELECLLETNKLFSVVNNLIQFHSKLEKDKLNIHKIYVINLVRRTERKEKMQKSLDLLGIEAEFWPAVDGKNLDKQYLAENKVSVLKNYLDPYHKRPITFGEIGCFMSHYNIWKDIIDNNHEISIIFEDDVRFERNFRSNFDELLNSINFEKIDFVYLGRKREGKAEDEVWYNKLSVYPTYSYWTIGYIITYNGAKKLINSNPLEKIIPVDEFLPIMFDKHPNSNWTKFFKIRNLKALSANPLLIQPLHYIGDEKYISDTEDSKNILHIQDYHLHHEL